MAKSLLLLSLAFLCWTTLTQIRSVNSAALVSSAVTDATEPADSDDATDAPTNPPNVPVGSTNGGAAPSKMPATNAPVVPSVQTENPNEPESETEGASNGPASVTGAAGTQPPQKPVTTQPNPEGNSSDKPEGSSTPTAPPTTTSAAPHNATCSDLRSNCDARRCDDDDHTRFLCANTCGSCQLRDQCYNAYGDQLCRDLDFFCDTQPIVETVCKKACGKCQPAANACQDVMPNCVASECSANNNNLWCAHTCGTCAVAAKCQDYLHARTCSWAKSSNQCQWSLYFQVLCKMSCERCF